MHLSPLPPASFSTQPSLWVPTRMSDPPVPPPIDTREAELAALAAQEKLGHDGKRQRVRPRRTIDPFGGLERWKIFRTTQTSIDDRLFMRANPSYLIDLLPPSAYSNASTSLCTRYAHTSTNKIRCPVNIVTWTPDARRVLTGSTSGEFTLWNGLTFNFETILQAHDTAVRAMSWSSSGTWLISADNSGVIKYFQNNMNNLQAFQGHKESIRDICFSPNDDRFVTGSDDGTIKIWNFGAMREERILSGHGWDVKCVKWHPTKGLLVSGSKDNLVKFWDPRTGTVLSTLHGHKNTIQACAWSPNGNLVATASRDQLVKVFDIRAMKELVTLRGHKDGVCSVAWHPIHEDLLVSGGSEGSILHWSMPDSTPKETIEFAHDSNVWSLAFHPLGHLLCSASNDHTTRFWSRGRIGEEGRGIDRWHLGKEGVLEVGGVVEDDQDDFVPGLKSYPRNTSSSGGPNRNMNNSNNNNNNDRNNNNRASSNQPNRQNGHQNQYPNRSDKPYQHQSYDSSNQSRAHVAPNQSQIPGFGRGQDSTSSYTGPGSAFAPAQSLSGASFNQSEYQSRGGGGGEVTSGMRRGGPLPSQLDALSRGGGGDGEARRGGNAGRR